MCLHCHISLPSSNCLFFSVYNAKAKADIYMYADEEEERECVVKEEDGELLGNGNFIFSWKDDGHRNMILTTNCGQEIKYGYIKDDSESNWNDPFVWKTDKQILKKCRITMFSGGNLLSIGLLLFCYNCR